MILTIALTQGYVAIIDDEDADLADLKWQAQFNRNYPKSGVYARRAFRQLDGSPASVFMHRIVLERILDRQLVKGEEVDHRNGNPLDNRRENLRLATRSENGRNRRLSTASTSGYKGVSLHKRSGKWHAAIKINGRIKNLGYFDTPEQAYAAYCESALELHGEFASLV